MKKDFVCQDDFGHKIWGVMSMFVVGPEFVSKRILHSLLWSKRANTE
jgi:hypothetical protein